MKKNLIKIVGIMGTVSLLSGLVGCSSTDLDRWNGSETKEIEKYSVNKYKKVEDPFDATKYTQVKLVYKMEKSEYDFY